MLIWLNLRSLFLLDLLIKSSGNLKINANPMPVTKANNGDPIRIAKIANSIPMKSFI